MVKLEVTVEVTHATPGAQPVLRLTLPAGARVAAVLAQGAVRAAFGDGHGSRHQLLAAFDRTRPGHHNKSAVANTDIANFDDRLLFFDFAADQFERLENWKRVFHPIGGFQRLNVLFFVTLADSGDDGSFGSANDVRRVTEFTYAVADVIYLPVCCS